MLGYVTKSVPQTCRSIEYVNLYTIYIVLLDWLYLQNFESCGTQLMQTSNRMQ